MSRILACNHSLDRYASMLPWFNDQGLEVIRCDRDDLLEQAIRSAPDLVLFGFGDDPEVDSPTLRVLKRMLPDAPLIFVAERATLGQRRALQEFKPTFWALAPPDEAELREAITSALKSRSGRQQALGRLRGPKEHRA